MVLNDYYISGRFSTNYYIWRMDQNELLEMGQNGLLEMDRNELLEMDQNKLLINGQERTTRMDRNELQDTQQGQTIFQYGQRCVFTLLKTKQNNNNWDRQSVKSDALNSTGDSEMCVHAA